MEHTNEDCILLYQNMEFEEEQLNNKRRWLMGLSMKSRPDQKRPKTSDFLRNTSLPESFVREDDISYEIVKNSIARGFGASTSRTKNCVVQDYLYLFETNKVPSDLFRALPSILEDMSNIGLCSLANIITGSSVNFEKTRSRMSHLIKEQFLKILTNPLHIYQHSLLEQLPKILKDPQNFRENRIKLSNSATMTHSCAASKLLEELEEMSTEVLHAMYRKLRGVQCDVSVKPKRSVWSRSRLINTLRNRCKKMLSKLVEGDELQKPLAKAMTVAALSFRLKQENSNLLFPKFCDFFPETEALQNEILKAIWSVDEMNIKILMELQHLIDPDVKLPSSHFRLTVRRILIEYLFECSEMDVIPKPLLEIIAALKKRISSSSLKAFSFSNENVEEEVENVLNVSSQIRQISLCLLGDSNFDKEFADAYLENSDYADDDSEIGASCSIIELERTDESRPFDEVGANSLPEHTYDPCQTDLSQFDSSFSPSYNSSLISCKLQNSNKNHYLAIQEICDHTSLVVHQLIGCLLEEYMQIQQINVESSRTSYLRGGALNLEATQASEEVMTCCQENIDGSVLFKVVRELLSSFPKSELQKVKELMGLL